MGSTEESQQMVIQNEWLDYFCQQQIIDDFDVPFGAISDPAVSDDTSFGDDPFLNVSGGGDDESILVQDGQPSCLTSSAGNTASAKGVVVSSENSSVASTVDLSPKAAIAKQVKRRSRASRRTPTTLLNASIKNFRTLVQQYTGCQSASPGFGRNGKGPITLSFGAANNDRVDFPASFEHGSYYQHQVDQIYAGRY